MPVTRVLDRGNETSRALGVKDRMMGAENPPGGGGRAESGNAQGLGTLGQVGAHSFSGFCDSVPGERSNQVFWGKGPLLVSTGLIGRQWHF